MGDTKQRRSHLLSTLPSVLYDGNVRTNTMSIARPMS